MEIKLNSWDLDSLESILDWIPEELFDFHVHLGLSHHHFSLSSERKISAMAASEHYKQSLKSFKENFKKLLPGRNISYVAFPFPFKETKVEFANDYVLNTPHPLILSNLKEPRRTIHLLEDSRVRGLKVYYDLVEKKLYQDISISDFVLPEFMEILNEEKKILMLHVPRNSLNNRENLREVSTLCERYPSATIVLAHMGRCHTSEDMRDSLKRLSGIENLFLDSSTISNPEVFYESGRILGSTKILYASDAPYSNTRGRILDVPGPMGKAFITREKYPWTIPSLRDWYLENLPPLTFLIYHQLEAMREGFSRADFVEQDYQNVFSRNAKRLLGISKD
jgi:hypothetical protein